MKKTRMKKLLIIFAITAITIAGSLTAYLLLKPKVSNESDYYTPGIVTVEFKEEYRNNVQLMDIIANSAGGKIDYQYGITSDGLYAVKVKEGKEWDAVNYLETRPEVESAFRDIPLGIH